MNILVSRFLAFTLSFLIVFSSTSAFAASPSGWTASGVSVNGAIATITAIKGSGSSALKSVITHAPTASKIGKEIIKGGGIIGVAYALSQLLGAGVDWVLDADNNRVKYTVPASPDEGSGYYVPQWGTGYYSSPESACRQAIAQSFPTWTFDYVDGKDCMATAPSGGGSQPLVDWKQSATQPNTPVEKYMPISSIADQIIADARTGNSPSQDVVRAAAIDSVNTGALDTELEASAVPNVGTTNPDGTVTNPDGSVTNPDGSVTNPDGTVTNPAIPSFDPSSIISAIESLGAILSAKFTSITEAIGLTNTKLDDIAEADSARAAEAKEAAEAKAAADAEFKDWATAEPAPLDPDTALDIDVPNILPVDTDINFGGSCPANFEVNSSIFGNPINIVLLDTSKFCGFLSTFVKFPVYAVSSLFALYILGGRKDV